VLISIMDPDIIGASSATMPNAQRRRRCRCRCSTRRTLPEGRAVCLHQQRRAQLVHRHRRRDCVQACAQQGDTMRRRQRHDGTMDVHLTCTILPAHAMLAWGVRSASCTAARSSVRISIMRAMLHPLRPSIDMSERVRTTPPALTVLVVTPMLWNGSMLGAMRSTGESSS